MLGLMIRVKVCGQGLRVEGEDQVLTVRVRAMG